MKKQNTPVENQTIEQLINTYRGYIFKVAQTLTNDEYINEELIQEGNIHLYLAKTRFNPEKGNFHSFAHNYIKGGMLMYLSGKSHTIRIPPSKISEFLVTEGSDFPTYIDIEKQTENGLTYSELLGENDIDNSEDDSQKLKLDRLKHYISQLNTEQIELISMRYKEDMKVKDIAIFYNTTDKEISSKLNKIRTALKQKFKDGNLNKQKYCYWNKYSRRWIVYNPKTGKQKHFLHENEAKLLAKNFLGYKY